MVAIASQKREVILQAVENMYTEVAVCPTQEFHFPIGRAACRFVGYQDADLRGVPETVVESFAGVGCPFAAGAVRPGDTVLDLGSGSGTDTFIASRLVGPTGKVYALDLTEAMRAKLSTNITKAGISNIEVLAGNAERIPLPDDSVDVVTSNGVLNLVPDKTRAIAEIRRVLKPGGRLQISDIALAKPVTAKARRDPKLWAECIVGAVEEENYFDLFRAAGFKNVERVGGLDYFAGSRNEDTRMMAGYFGAHSVTFRARKPEVWETARADAGAAPLRAIVANGAKQIAGIGGAITASAACFGAPALLAAASAIGAGFLADHAVLYPIFVGSIAFSVWQLHRSARARSRFAPFVLGAAGGVTAAVFLWLMVTGIVPLPGWALYAALGALVAGSLWEIGARYYEDCIVTVRRAMAPPPAQPPLGRRMANGAAISVAAAAVFYGLYKSVDAAMPKAQAADIACYGINACKGQTQCATAFNGCPGTNACAGKGFRYASPQQCAEQGGVPLQGSPADPAGKNA